MKFYYVVSGTVNDLYKLVSDLEAILGNEYTSDQFMELKGKRYSANACISFIIDNSRMTTTKFLAIAPIDVEAIVYYHVNGADVFLEKESQSNKLRKIDDDDQLSSILGTMLALNTHITYTLDPSEELEHYELCLGKGV